MKKMMTLAMMMTIAIRAAAMTYTEARNEALFLSDKMAYELGLSNAQYEAVYEINFDYFYSVNSRYDVNGVYWSRRNLDLSYVLTAYQFNLYTTMDYFYRPLDWYNGAWHFTVYGRYTNRNHFYRSRPTVYVTYTGGRNRHTTSFYAGWNNRPAAPHKENNVSVRHNSHNTQPVATRNHGEVFDHNNKNTHNNHSASTGRPATPKNNNPKSRPNNNSKGTFGGSAVHK